MMTLTETTDRRPAGQAAPTRRPLGRHLTDAAPEGFAQVRETPLWIGPKCAGCGTASNWRDGWLNPCYCKDPTLPEEIRDTRADRALWVSRGWLASGSEGDPDRLWGRCPDCTGLAYVDFAAGQPSPTCTGKVDPSCGRNGQ